jgi:hypothetical protein
MTRSHTWVPYAAAAAGALLLIEGVLVVASSDRISNSPMVVMYFGGIIAALTAAVGLGLRRRSVWARVGVAFGASLLLVAWFIGLGAILNPVIEVFSDAKYVRDEVPIAFAGVVLLAIAGRAFLNDTDTAR